MTLALILTLAAAAIVLIGALAGRRLEQHRAPVRVPPAHPRYTRARAIDSIGDEVNNTVFRPDRP